MLRIVRDGLTAPASAFMRSCATARSRGVPLRINSCSFYKCHSALKPSRPTFIGSTHRALCCSVFLLELLGRLQILCRIISLSAWLFVVLWTASAAHLIRIRRCHCSSSIKCFEPITCGFISLLPSLLKNDHLYSSTTGAYLVCVLDLLYILTARIGYSSSRESSEGALTRFTFGPVVELNAHAKSASRW